MNILILGASSQIGCRLALCFSINNSLTLLGRNDESLQSVALQCLVAGAAHVDVIVHDMAVGVEPLIQKVGGRQFDLVVNLVAATSRVKDSEFLPGELERFLMSDLLVPVQLLQNLIEKSSKPMRVIFISSVLASVKSPDRFIYGSLKSLQEICLRKLSAGRQGFELLVVKVGKVIQNEQSSEESQKLAVAIHEAYFLNKKVLNYGLGGRVYLALFHIQPLIFTLIVKLQRVLRKR